MVRIRGGFRPMDGPGGFFRRSEGKHTTPLSIAPGKLHKSRLF
jgi:hypothetical protein